MIPPASLEKVLEGMEGAVALRDPARLDEAADEALRAGCPREEAAAALTRGLERARRAFAENNLALPEFLLCLDIMEEGAARLSKLPARSLAPASRPRMVIGVAQGDVHDLGKNVVAAVCRAYGFEVTDLGRDVAPGAFLAAVKKNKAHVMAVSAMMSTPLTAMRETVALCRRERPDTIVLVGGAAVDETLARLMGANATAPNAGLLPGLFSNLKLLPAP